MNKLNILSLIISLCFLFSGKAFSGMDYNNSYYSKHEINQIIEELSNPDASTDWDAFYRVRSQFLRQANEQAGYLSEQEIYALERYQDDAYKQIREGLNLGQFDEETAQLIQNIDTAFENGIKYQGVVFRGESLLDAYGSVINVGDIVSPSSFLSASVSKSSAAIFHKGQMSRFELISGEHGIIIPTVRDDELEVLINRNSLFEVSAINITEEGNQIVYREVLASQIGHKEIKDMHTGEQLTVSEACY